MNNNTTGAQSHGGYWQTSTTTSGGSTDTTYITIGTGGAMFPVTIARCDSEPVQTVESAGVRAGEIIAYRAWWLDENGLLHSIFMDDFVWSPRGVGRATTPWSCFSPPERLPLEYHGCGYHALKDLEQVRRTYCWPAENGPIVYGQVALWGDVLECERGYRAEYAKVHKIIGFATPLVLTPWRLITLIKLRRRYGV